jgi:nucleotide-binding universal stress UspA family protein
MVSGLGSGGGGVKMKNGIDKKSYVIDHRCSHKGGKFAALLGRGDSHIGKSINVKNVNYTTDMITAEPKRNLVLAVDMLEGSRHMCRWVLENVYRKNDVVHLVYCLPPLPTQTLYTLPDGRLAMVNVQKLLDDQDAYEASVEKSLEEFVKKTFDESKVHVVRHVLKQEEFNAGNKHSIASMLCEEASKLSAAVLVIASHMSGGFAEALSGSIAADCARHCDCPVMVLHDAQRKRRTASSDKDMKTRIRDWLSAMGAGRSVGEADMGQKGTVSAVAGPYSAKVDAEKGGIVSSSDFDDDEDELNLIGQTVSELPGLGQSVEEELLSMPADVVHEEGRSKNGRTILLPVDDSEASDRALDWLIEHFYRKKDTIVLLHLIPSLPSVLQVYMSPALGISPAYFYASDSIEDEYRKSTESILEERFFKKLRRVGARYKGEIVLELADSSSSGIGEAICSRAAELGANTIIIGSHSRGGIPELMLGSVANWVDHHASVPVVVVH